MKTKTSIIVSVDIWKPVGKEPNSLWMQEMLQFNQMYRWLYDYFKTHESYSYIHNVHSYDDPIVSKFGSLGLGRVQKWLSYLGLLNHTTVRQNNKLVHILTPTASGGQAMKGKVVTVRHGELCKIGIGLPYADYEDLWKWRDEQYQANHVAQWRQAKWQSDFKDVVYKNLASKKEGMMKALTVWLFKQVATIPKRGKKAQIQAALTDKRQRRLM